MIQRMKFNVNGLWLLAITIASSFITTSCSKDETVASSEHQKSIVILYENDVHCGVSGYTKLAGLRDAIVATDTAYVAVVSCGDFLQGGTMGAISKGQYIVDIMRNVGYDAITIGNHEFDYGAPRMEKLLKDFNAPVLCANYFHVGATTPFYAPYVIKQYGQKRIAFVGVCTPETMIAECYSFYDDMGNLLYDLKPWETYSLVQKATDEARSKGADYVVLLSHLGEKKNVTGIDSPGMVAATTGIDVLLDGHSHSVIEHQYEKNLEGKEIAITQTGTQFANIGKLVITKDGHISTTLIPADEIAYTNSRINTTVDSVTALMNEVTSRKIGYSDYDLSINGPDGKRLVRNGETNLGDLISDANRFIMNADIGLVNGGGIRNSIPAGDITYYNAIDIQPFDNHLYKIEATGAQILNMLEKCTANTPAEDGNFPQVSGLKFTIHTVSHRVSDVMVLNIDTNEYQPLDLAKTYTIGTTDYVARGGFYETLKECKILVISTLLTRDAFASYLGESLGGKLGERYRSPQGRITIIED